MNAGLVHAIESLFGPPSEPIDVDLFLESSSSSLLQDNVELKGVSDAELIDECR